VQHGTQQTHQGEWVRGPEAHHGPAAKAELVIVTERLSRLARRQEVRASQATSPEQRHTTAELVVVVAGHQMAELAELAVERLAEVEPVAMSEERAPRISVAVVAVALSVVPLVVQVVRESSSCGMRMCRQFQLSRRRKQFLQERQQRSQ